MRWHSSPNYCTSWSCSVEQTFYDHASVYWDLAVDDAADPGDSISRAGVWWKLSHSWPMIFRYLQIGPWAIRARYDLVYVDDVAVDFLKTLGWTSPTRRWVCQKAMNIRCDKLHRELIRSLRVISPSRSCLAMTSPEQITSIYSFLVEMILCFEATRLLW